MSFFVSRRSSSAATSRGLTRRDFISTSRRVSSLELGRDESRPYPRRATLQYKPGHDGLFAPSTQGTPRRGAASLLSAHAPDEEHASVEGRFSTHTADHGNSVVGRGEAGTLTRSALNHNAQPKVQATCLGQKRLEVEPLEASCLAEIESALTLSDARHGLLVAVFDREGEHAERSRHASTRF